MHRDVNLQTGTPPIDETPYKPQLLDPSPRVPGVYSPNETEWPQYSRYNCESGIFYKLAGKLATLAHILPNATRCGRYWTNRCQERDDAVYLFREYSKERNFLPKTPGTHKRGRHNTVVI